MRSLNIFKAKGCNFYLVEEEEGNTVWKFPKKNVRNKDSLKNWHFSTVGIVAKTPIENIKIVEVDFIYDHLRKKGYNREEQVYNLYATPFTGKTLKKLTLKDIKSHRFSPMVEEVMNSLFPGKNREVFSRIIYNMYRTIKGETGDIFIFNHYYGFEIRDILFEVFSKIGIKPHRNSLAWVNKPQKIIVDLWLSGMYLQGLTVATTNINRVIDKYIKNIKSGYPKCGRRYKVDFLPLKFYRPPSYLVIIESPYIPSDLKKYFKENNIPFQEVKITYDFARKISWEVREILWGRGKKEEFINQLSRELNSLFFKTI